jgi:UDP-N-acetyl-D-mannosaminuronic acid dehydrogenase
LSEPGAFGRDVCVIGGGGHVGLPLAMMFADAGLRAVAYDINSEAVRTIRQGIMPFAEEGGTTMLKRVLAAGKLEATDSPELISQCEFVFLAVGTPVDEHLTPSFTAIDKVIHTCGSQLRDGQVLVLRSTVFPGTSRRINEMLKQRGRRIGVACCPERVPQGYSLQELAAMPQLISAFDTETLARVRKLFSRFNNELVEMEPMEAELCKLMTNAWRYLQFAAVNQFYMLATEHGVDFQRILHGCRFKYPRMAGMPGPGLAAGPCLLKDTMQLAAFSQNQFILGHGAMLINEGLPGHLVHLAKQRADLTNLTAGILGMAFKAESDDIRDSLSYKLRKLLSLEARHVLCCDPYVDDPGLVPVEQVLRESDVLFVATPHKAYRGLKIPAGKQVIDVWNCVDSAGSAGSASSAGSAGNRT